MHISIIGLNHKTAPIDIREKFYLTPTQQELFLSELKCNPAIAECFIFSTCNRTEVYAHIIDDGLSPDLFIRMIMNIKKIQFSQEFKSYFYRLTNEEATQHLFKVTCGLDSLVLGEKQILGQVKEFFECARRMGMFSKHFNILSNLAIRAGKKAQTETNISLGGSSISWAAIAMAEKHLGTLENKSMLIIGAGKMSELAVTQIQNKGLKKLYLMNRTAENAENLATKYGGEAVGFCDIKEVLSQVDLCICSVGAPHYIIDKSTVERTMSLREARQLIFIDISMPRNIDPQVAELKDMLLYTIDDLKEVVDSNMKLREQSITEVQNIIQQKITEYEQKISRLNLNHTFDDLEKINNL